MQHLHSIRLTEQTKHRRTSVPFLRLALPLLLATLLVTVLLFSIIGSAQAQVTCDGTNTITITSNDDGSALRTMITNAADGSTICIEPGGDNKTITLASEILLGKSLTISGTGAENVIFDANGASINIFRIPETAPDKNFTLKGVTVKNANKTAVFFRGGGAVLIEDVLFENNVSTGSGALVSGGGLNIYKNLAGNLSDVQVLNSVFRNNSSQQGGGVYMECLNAPIKTLTIENSRFYSNVAQGSDTSRGGAVNITSCLVDIKDSWFEDNFSPDFGGAIAAGSGSIVGTTFISNTSSHPSAPNRGSGGGLWVSSSVLDSTLTISDSNFVSNTASTKGGGIYTLRPFSITNTIFAGNRISHTVSDTANDFGGGALFARTDLTLAGSDFSAVLENIHFEANHAPAGGAIYRQWQGSSLSGSSPFNPPMLGSSLAFTDNVATGGPGVSTARGMGGAIYNIHNPMTITHSSFVSNTALGGGGIGVRQTNLVVLNSQFYSNTATGTDTTSQYMGGGALLANGLTSANRSISIEESRFEQNRSETNGGAVAIPNASRALGITIKSTDFYSNSASSNGVGGAANIQPSGSGTLATPLTIENSTFGHNQAGVGGGLYVQNRVPMTLESNSFYHNTASSGIGGAIAQLDTNGIGKLQATNNTLAYNTATTEGGGIYVSGVPLESVNLTISHNEAITGGGLFVGTGMTATLTNTLVVNSTGGDIAGDGLLTGTNNLSGTLTMGILQDNGGSTWTMLPGAAAIDAGTDDGCPAVDQRGESRPIGAACDIGAVELAAEADTSLSDLTINPGVLSPTFISTTLAYTAVVPYNGTPLTVTPTASSGNVTVQVSQNGGVSATCSGNPASCDLALGSNVITTTVTADDGSSTDYVVTVTRAGDGSLDPLAVGTAQGPVTLTPSFISSTLAYTAMAGHLVDSVTLTGTVMPNSGDVISTVVGQNGGTPLACAAPIAPAVATPNGPVSCELVVGTNVITSTVTALDGTTKEYVVTITRASDATLSGLDLAPAVLTPSFISSTLAYTASVGFSVDSLPVTATTSYGDDQVSVVVSQNGGTPLNCPASAYDCDLAVGTNVITTTVTAADGTAKTYVVTVTRAASSNADLSNLTLSNGTLTPVFASATTTYTAAVANAVTSTAVTATAADSGATITSVTVSQNGGTDIACPATDYDCPLAEGTNVITVTVTAADNSTKTYVVTVTRAAPGLSSNADLSNLALSNGTLTPVFASATTTYTAAVANAVTSTAVTATAADSGASITSVTVSQNGGTDIACPATDYDCPLAEGTNVITVTVTAADNSTKTYVVTVTRAAPGLSSNADLSNLALSNGTLTPVFASATTAYTAAVANAVTSTAVTATAADSGATITSVTVSQNGGTDIACPATAYDCPLAVGSNVITVTVTAADNSTKTYTVTVTRAASSNADLSNLTLSNGTLTPSFASGTTTYTAAVANAVTSTAVTATAADSGASITSVTVSQNGGTDIACPATAYDCPLAVGSNVITVTVTAADNSTKTYTVTVTRAASSNADLSNLTLSNGTLTPSFASGTTTYTAAVANAVTSTAVTATAADSGATITSVTVSQNGDTDIACPATAYDCPLAVGANVITVTVTAADGTVKTYTVTVTRAAPGASSNADLSNLALSNSTLTPAFAATVTTYTAAVANAVTSTAVTATAADSGATITSVTVSQNGDTDIACPATAYDCPLAEGTNVITVTVTAADNSTKTYVVTVTRAAPGASSNADLSGLSLSNGTLTPSFDAGVTTYTAAVSSDVTSSAVTATADDSGATITSVTVSQNGGTDIACPATDYDCPLAEGTNVITVTVTAADGTVKTYTVTVTRAGDGLLDGLRIRPGVLVPAFERTQLDYTATVGDNVTRTVVTAQPQAGDVVAVQVSQNGGAPIACDSAGLCPLAFGTNVITVSVTASDGSVNEYQITVTRTQPDSSDSTLADLDLARYIGGGVTETVTLNPGFSPTTVNYTATVAYETGSILVNAQNNDAGASLKVTVKSPAGETAPCRLSNGVPFCPLEMGENVVTITVSAADGSRTTYTVTVTRAEPTVVFTANDAWGTLEGEAITQSPLLNDADPAGQGLTIIAVSQPSKGTAVISQDGKQITYTPTPGQTGLDSFTYTAQDGSGADSTSTVAVVITVKVKDQAPKLTVVNPNRTTQSTIQSDTGDVDMSVPPGSYNGQAGPLGPRDVFYIAYTDVVTPTENVQNPPTAPTLAAEVNAAATTEDALSFAGKIFTLEAFFNDIELADYEFPEPVTFTVGYRDELIGNLKPETLQLFYWDEDTQAWSQDGLTFVGRDLTARTITYLVAHFTEFAFFGVPQETGRTLYLPFVERVVPVYTSTFDDDVTTGWGVATLTTAPNGERFLGEFGNGGTTLTLSQLPQHNRVTVSFDLYILRSWDGNQVELPDDFDPYLPLRQGRAADRIGPDRVQVRSGDVTLFDATFSNWAQFTQSYPAPDSPAQSGAVAVNALGYTYLEWQKDATYRIHLSFEHSDPTLVLDFVAEGLQGIGDESWGIDNVAVIVQ